MKKVYLLLALSCVTLLVGACGQASATDSTDSPATSESSIAAETTTDSESAEAVFTGVLKEDAAAEESDTVRIVLGDVEAVTDPENMAESFKNDGVILNVGADQLDAKKEELTKGVKVTFTTSSLSIMTMSIPPQIPGNSIISVTLAE